MKATHKNKNKNTHNTSHNWIAVLCFWFAVTFGFFGLLYLKIFSFLSIFPAAFSLKHSFLFFFFFFLLFSFSFVPLKITLYVNVLNKGTFFILDYCQNCIQQDPFLLFSYFLIYFCFVKYIVCISIRLSIISPRNSLPFSFFFFFGFFISSCC